MLIIDERTLPKLISLADLKPGQCFIKASKLKNHLTEGQIFMKIWANSGQYRYVNLGTGVTWSGATDVTTAFEKNSIWLNAYLLRVEVTCTITGNKCS